MSRSIISGGQRSFGSQRSNITRGTFSSGSRSFRTGERSFSSGISRGNMKERENQYPAERSKASSLKKKIFSHTFNSIFK